MLKNFRIDKSQIEQRFNTQENGKKYAVLKPGINKGLNLFPDTYDFDNDEDFVHMPAKLVYDNLKIEKKYRENSYTFYPYNEKGIDIAHSLIHIKEFMAIWSYLHKELLVLEVKKDIDKEEIALFLQGFNKKAREEREEHLRTQKTNEILAKRGLTPYEIVEEDTVKFNRFITVSHEVKEIDAYKFVDEFLEFNDDALTISDYYLDKKIIATPRACFVNPSH